MKKVQILSVVLVVQFLLIVALYVNFSNNSQDLAQVSGIDNIDQSNQIIIEADNQALTLQKLNNQWQISGANLPANLKKVEDLLQFVSSLNNSWTVSTEPKTQSRYKVASDDFQTKISLKQDDTAILTVYVGETVSINKTYVRAEGSNDIFTDKVNLQQLNTDSSVWLDKGLLASKDFIAALSDNFQIAKQDANSEWSLYDSNKQLVPSQADKIQSFVDAVENFKVLSLFEIPFTEADFQFAVRFANGDINTYAFYEEKPQQEGNSSKYYVISSLFQNNFEIAEQTFNAMRVNLNTFKAVVAVSGSTATNVVDLGVTATNAIDSGNTQSGIIVTE